MVAESIFDLPIYLDFSGKICYTPAHRSQSGGLRKDENRRSTVQRVLRIVIWASVWIGLVAVTYFSLNHLLNPLLNPSPGRGIRFATEEPAELLLPYAELSTKVTLWDVPGADYWELVLPASAANVKAAVVNMNDHSTVGLRRQNVLYLVPVKEVHEEVSLAKVYLRVSSLEVVKVAYMQPIYPSLRRNLEETTSKYHAAKPVREIPAGLSLQKVGALLFDRGECGLVFEKGFPISFVRVNSAVNESQSRSETPLQKWPHVQLADGRYVYRFRANDMIERCRAIQTINDFVPWSGLITIYPGDMSQQEHFAGTISRHTTHASNIFLEERLEELNRQGYIYFR